MNKLTRCGLLASLLALAALCGRAEAAPLASGLKASARDGQIFLTWKEAETPGGTTFNVYLAASPIADVKRAQRIGHHIERQSAMDWWEDKASFSKQGESDRSRGYRLQGTDERLDPTGGLFVHTVARNTRGRLYFAVTHTDAAGKEDATVIPGVNALSDGVAAAPGNLQPIWQRAGRPPEPGTGKGKGLWLNLHGKSGVVADSEYLAFGDATMGWREGLPFRFSVRVQGDEVVIRPTDRTWINRPHNEAGDGGAPAIWTFWYGYNSNIYDRERMAQGTPTNYTERRLLWILDWVGRQYQTDPKRWYCSGSSMGGCGTISFGLRHPELFAACHAHVPIVSYTYLGKGSAHRLEPSCWIGAITSDVKTNEGVPLLERLNGTKFITETRVDLPFLFILNGRKDDSIPWENNPPFYRALSDGANGFAVYWDDGEHSTAGKGAPDDVKAWTQRFRRFRLDQSFPAFAHTSSNRDAGNGQPADGDLIGWINRGMDWKDIEDEPDHYAIAVLADYPGIEYPVKTDVTLRRVQQFKTGPGAKLSVVVGDARPVAVDAGPTGRISIPSVVIPSSAGVRIVIRRR
ncbi:MAG: prolyl oligopeptidase family serine peptidase [Verrucomicrobia bacterium]|nr:prolyl oligopeptidase family serine peptidase [Verrucomicrobiota bacterium]